MKPRRALPVSLASVRRTRSGRAGRFGRDRLLPVSTTVESRTASSPGLTRRSILGWSRGSSLRVMVEWLAKSGKPDLAADGHDGQVFPSRSHFVTAGGASRSCVAAAPWSLLISHHKVQRPAGPSKVGSGFNGTGFVGECTGSINKILIVFPLACSIRGRGRFGRLLDITGRQNDWAGCSQGWV